MGLHVVQSATLSSTTVSSTAILWWNSAKTRQKVLYNFLLGDNKIQFTLEGRSSRVNNKISFQQTFSLASSTPELHQNNIFEMKSRKQFTTVLEGVWEIKRKSCFARWNGHEVDEDKSFRRPDGCWDKDFKLSVSKRVILEFRVSEMGLGWFNINGLSDLAALTDDL